MPPLLRPAWIAGGLLLALPLLPARADDDRPVDFDKQIRPLFERSCHSCHGPDKQRSGLRLDRKADALKGGDLGASIVPGQGDDSPIVQYIAGLDPDMLMPPKGERLTADEVALVRAWIDQGAPWPDDKDGGGEDRLRWWSFRPLVRPAVPVVEGLASPNPIDAFVAAKLREKGLDPAPAANRRALIRRLSFDLIGLPPTPAEIEAFRDDPAPDAYERLVERLLASPHYGERWARHWLDVAHYGDTHGYDKDKPRPNAWPYRDYLIRAFNEDRPYARFVGEQIAGDVLAPGTAQGIEALGFIAAGPWDFIGHAEVPESKIDGRIARHLDRDDMVANTLNTFASLTVQCAQCHDHKFDPIAQEDYYSLHAVFAALDRADRPYYNDPAVARRAAELASLRRRLDEEKRRLDAEAARLAGDDLARLDREIALAESPARGPERPEFGYHSGIEPAADRAKWVQLDLGRPTAIDRIVFVGCHDDFAGIGAGFGFPPRYRIEIADDPEFRDPVVVLDRTDDDQPNPGVRPQAAEVGGRLARFVRFTATRLAPRQNDFIFALAELRILDASGRDLATGATIAALDSIEAPPRWRKANLVDGYYFGRSTEDARAALEELKNRRRDLLEQRVDEPTLTALVELAAALAKVDAEKDRLPAPALVYAGTVHQGGGTFVGTGATGGKPRPIHVLPRGDVRKPGREVGPGAIRALAFAPGRFDLPEGHTEADRRAALARWIVDPDNPLTWRSIVNRIWRYHFGRGIVETPNDFGRMGQQPTHPELLDWLAAEFRDGGGSIKELHRKIVTSDAYRRSSMANATALEQDADNAFLSRMNRRKLDAESIRDSVLAVSGALSPDLFGPPFQDFVVEKPEHSPHYLYDRFDPANPAGHRRSIYRFLVRSQQQPFMTALDCADPSMQVDRRNETLSALQALALLNDGFMLVMSQTFADRVAGQGADTPARIDAAFRLAIGRAPGDDERRAMADYADRHGLPNACRLLFNLNEFVFVD